MSRSISESPLDFEITRVDCIWSYPGKTHNDEAQTSQATERRKETNKTIQHDKTGITNIQMKRNCNREPP